MKKRIITLTVALAAVVLFAALTVSVSALEKDGYFIVGKQGTQTVDISDAAADVYYWKTYASADGGETYDFSKVVYLNEYGLSLTFDNAAGVLQIKSNPPTRSGILLTRVFFKDESSIDVYTVIDGGGMLGLPIEEDYYLPVVRVGQLYTADYPFSELKLLDLGKFRLDWLDPVVSVEGIENFRKMGWDVRWTADHLTVCSVPDKMVASQRIPLTVTLRNGAVMNISCKVIEPQHDEYTYVCEINEKAHFYLSFADWGLTGRILRMEGDVDALEQCGLSCSYTDREGYAPNMVIGGTPTSIPAEPLSVKFWFDNGDTATFSVHVLSHTEYKQEKCDHYGPWRLTGARAATCTSEGYSGDYVCPKCLKVCQKGEVIPKLPHAPSDWICDKAAAVGVPGTKHKECTVCHAVLETGKIPALTAECPHSRTKLISAAAASCTENGYSGDTYCTDCGKLLAKGEVLPALGHLPGEWHVDMPATEQRIGHRYRNCDRCGIRLDEENMPTICAHVRKHLHGAVDPSCISVGYTGDVICDVCGTVIEKGHEIPKTDHVEGSWHIDKAAAPGVEGAKHTECVVCRTVIRTEKIPALPGGDNPPVTNPPVTNPPVTEPPATEPPATEPPATELPATEPPATEPPATEPPATEPPATEPVVTNPPVTEPPATEPPATEPVDPGKDEPGLPWLVIVPAAVVAVGAAAFFLVKRKKK